MRDIEWHELKKGQVAEITVTRRVEGHEDVITKIEGQVTHVDGDGDPTIGDMGVVYASVWWRDTVCTAKVIKEVIPELPKGYVAINTTGFPLDLLEEASLSLQDAGFRFAADLIDEIADAIEEKEAGNRG